LSKLAVSQILGREKELTALKRAFGETKCGISKLVLIEGESGVGKSTLVHSLQKYVASRGGAFIAGKYDRVHKNVPFSALIQGFTKFIDVVLDSDSEQIKALEVNLRKALGNNARPLVKLVPALQKIIVMQESEFAELPQDREGLIALFHNFIYAFATDDNPLVLFLDDLQWADSASRQLVLSLLTVDQPNGVLIVSTLRSGELTDSHPVKTLLEDLNAASVPFERFQLGNLTAADVQQYVSVRLSGAEFANEIGAVIFEKTHGNPFFVGQFFETLLDTKALAFSNGQWEHHEALSKAINMTENVAELVTSRIETLSASAKTIITMAACFGNRLTVDDLLDATTWMPVGIKEGLDEIHNLGLFELKGNTYYFAHDRIHEVAYALMNDDAKALNHYKIAKGAIKRLDDSEKEKKAFFLARQFNAGKKHVKKVEERNLVVLINLSAAKNARESGLYESVAYHVASALEIIPEMNWKLYSDVLFPLFLMKAEATAYAGNVAEADELFKYLQRNVGDIESKAKIFNTAALIKQSLGRYSEGIDLGLRGLRTLGKSFVLNPGSIRNLIHLLRVRRKLKSIGFGNLIHLPKRKVTSFDNLIVTTGINAYFRNKPLYAYLSLDSCLRVFSEGHTAGSWTTLSMYTSLLANKFKKYKEAKKLSDVIIHASEGSSDLERSEVAFMVHSFVTPWVNKVEVAVEGLSSAFDRAQRAGAVQPAKFSALYKSSYAFEFGRPLREVEEGMRETLPYIRRHHDPAIYDSLEATRLAIKCLQGETVTKGSFATDQMSEKDFVDGLRKSPSPNPLAWFGINRVWVSYVLGNFVQALEFIPESEQFLKCVPFAYGVVIHHTFSTLTYLKASEHSLQDRIKYYFKIRRGIKKLKQWAKLNPTNFEAYYQLVSGEQDRINGKSASFIYKMQKAVLNARLTQNANIETLAEELLANECFVLGYQKEAVEHLRASIQVCTRWGAKAKNDQLLSKLSAVEQKTVELVAQVAS
jgi:ABC-type cobalamin/Fe3+-siderophores transport system ATPase subunit